MSTGEFPGGQPFDAQEARATYERHLRATYGALNPDNLEGRIAQGMQGYDERQGSDEITGGDSPARENGSDSPPSTKPSWYFELEDYAETPERQLGATRSARRRPSRNSGRTSRAFAAPDRQDRHPFEFQRQPVMTRPNKKAAGSGRLGFNKGITASIAAVAVVAGAGVWFTSGNSNEDAPSKGTAAKENRPSQSVVLAGRSLAMYEMSEALRRGDKKDIAQAERTIPQISTGDTELDASLHQAVNYAKADNILTNRTADSEYVFISDSITDVPLRQRTDTVLYTLNADEVLKTMGGTAVPTPEAARREMGQAPKGAEMVEAHAKEAIEIKQINGALLTYRTSTKDQEALATVQAVADKVSSPELKQKMQSFIQGLTAAELLEDLRLGDIPPAEVVAYAQTVADSQLQADLVRLSGEIDEYGYYSEAGYYASELSSHLYDTQAQQFGDNNTNFAADLSNARNERRVIGLEASQAAGDAEAVYTETLAEEAEFEPGVSGPVLVQETDPYEVIDLTDVKATQKVPHVSQELLETSGDIEEQPEYFAQFGEVYIDDGQMQVRYQEGLSPTLKAQFDQALTSNDPLLRAAFDSGTLTSLRLVLADEFRPSYNKTTREAIIQVANDNQMTVDQLSSAITHEVGGHAILRDYFRGVEVTDAEHQALAEACFDLQALTYKSLEGQLSIREELLINLRAAAEPAHRAALDTLAQAIANHSLTSLLRDYTHVQSTVSNTCDYTGNPAAMIVNAIYATPSIDPLTFKVDDISYLFETAAYQEFKDAVSLHLEYGSIFSEVINESNYIMTGSSDKLYAGHSREDANELFASLMDAALNYPDQLQANLAALDPEEAQAVLRTLALACNVLETRAPSLGPLLDGTRQKFGIIN